MAASFEEFYELLCVIRNEQKRITEDIRKLRAEIKLDPARISYTLREAAEATGYSYHTLYHLAKEGRLKVSQTEDKGKMVVTREELLRLLEDMSTLKITV